MQSVAEKSTDGGQVILGTDSKLALNIKKKKLIQCMSFKVSFTCRATNKITPSMCQVCRSHPSEIMKLETGSRRLCSE